MNAAPDSTTIVTLRLDEESQRFFEGMRQRYYPAHLNRIAAHLTLFHTLPEARWVRDVLLAEAGVQVSFDLKVTGVRSLGKGVAYKLASDELLGLHGRLAAAFVEELTAQDRQRFSPHVVVMNKASAVAAKDLLVELERDFKGFEVRGVGLDWWRYLGGPWELMEGFGFPASY